jgi:hypothetical protein
VKDVCNLIRFLITAGHFHIAVVVVVIVALVYLPIRFDLRVSVGDPRQK